MASFLALKGLRTRKAVGFDYKYFTVRYKMERLFKEIGIDCCNPARIETGENWRLEYYMRECNRNIPYCTHMYMLKGWEKLQGVTIEYLFRKIGIKVVY